MKEVTDFIAVELPAFLENAWLAINTAFWGAILLGFVVTARYMIRWWGE